MVRVLDDVHDAMAETLSPRLRRVINATGIVLHTNLGRAPLAKEAIEAIEQTASGYTNIEYDVASGGRGSRTSIVEQLLCELTGAEAAAVVNNNAAAVLLTLNTLARGKGAVVSRGQLVEIGGSFRIPDIMERSGARMVEVGTTNRTHIADYEHALTDDTGLMLSVHPSNYRVMGFTLEVPIVDLAALGRRRGVAVAHDLGGGVLVDLKAYGLPYEPLVSDSVTAGVDVVTFSGDKILGGPQAGILVGRRDPIEQIRRNPLMRALRCGKLTYAALEATLRLFLNRDDLINKHPTLQMLTVTPATLRRRGKRLLDKVAESSGSADRVDVSLEPSTAQTGSGALPLEDIPSVALVLAPKKCSAGELARQLRERPVPIVGYVREDRVWLDLRTVAAEELKVVGEEIGRIRRGG